MKKALRGLLCLILTLLLSACAITEPPQHLTFSEDILRITLDDSFEAFESDTYDIAWISDKQGYVVAVLSEYDDLIAPHTDETETGSQENPSPPLSLEAYGKLCIEKNQLNATVETLQGMTYFVYDKDIQGDTFTYMVMLYHADLTYWQVIFACPQKFYQDAVDDFIAYAQSITFETNQTI